jgi:outer membrane protein assembly factor BamB
MATFGALARWSLGVKILLTGVLLTSVGCLQTDPTLAQQETPAAKQREGEDAAAGSEPRDAAREVDEPELADLGTRKTGVDWPQFLGPNRDSKSPETGLITPWPEGGPRIVWQRELGTGYGIGSISRGRYFHFDRVPDNGPGRARLTCLHAETGEELWKFEYPTDYEDLLGYNNGPRCSPLVDGSRVYIFGAEGMLHCLRAADGELIWKFDTSAKYGVVQNFFGVGSSPVIDGDLLICMVGGSPPGSPGLYESGGEVTGNGSGIVAFNKYTGKPVYQITDELASYSSPQLATIDGRRWCFMFCRGGLVGFEPQSGKVDFQYPWRAKMLESVNASTPVVVGNEVFISETYQIGSSLLAVRPGGYDVVWQDERRSRDHAMKTHWNTAIHVDGYVYGCSGRNPPDADLRCVRWKDGKVMWVQQEPLATRERSSLLYVDGHFIAVGEYGSLRLLKVNPERYELVSEAILLRDEPNPNFGPRPLLKYPAWAAPILSHGLLYVRGDDRLVCLEVIPDQPAP